VLPQSAPYACRLCSSARSAQHEGLSSARPGSRLPRGRSATNRVPATRNGVYPRTTRSPTPPDHRAAAPRSAPPPPHPLPPRPDRRLITPQRRRLVRRPRPCPNLTCLRSRQPLRRHLFHRKRTRRSHHLPANRRLALLPPRPRLRQRPKRSPNRLVVPPRPHLRLIRQRTPAPTPAPARTPALMTNSYPLKHPPTPNTPFLPTAPPSTDTDSSAPPTDQLPRGTNFAVAVFLAVK
jgi:hypothetical protein